MAVMMRQMSNKSLTMEKTPLEYERAAHAKRLSQRLSEDGVLTSSLGQGKSLVDDSGTTCFADPFWKVKALYAFPQLSLLSLTMLINIHVIIFYNEVGVRLSFLSFFQIFSRSFDVLTDPMMAHVSDNLTQTRFGRRKPWISIGAPMYAIAFFFLMSPPGDAGDGSKMNTAASWWFGASYLVFYLSDTLANIPLFALGPELSDDPEERNGLFMWSKVFEGLGTMSGGALPIVLLTFYPKKTAFQIMAGTFGGWYLFWILGLMNYVTERPASLESKGGISFVPAVFRAFSNPAFRVLAMSWILDYCALAVFVGVMPFYFNYYLYEGTEVADRLFSACVSVLFFTGFCCIPFWRLVGTQPDPDFPKWYDFVKLGARNAWLTYNLINAVTNFLFIIIQPRQDFLALVFSALNGIPVGGQFLMLSMLANVVDYDEFLNFSRKEGTFVVLPTFVAKMAAIPAQSLPLVIIFMLGFKDPIRDKNATKIFPQNPRVVMFLRIMFSVVPAILASLSWFLKRLFPIKTYEIMQQISDGIVMHKQGLPAIDPITGESVVVSQWTDMEEEDLDRLNHFSFREKVTILREKTTQNVTRSVTCYIATFSFLFVACCVGVISTWPLLNNQRWAILPALCCVGIGTSAALVSFSVMRLNAARDVQKMIETTGNGILNLLERQMNPVATLKESPEESDSYMDQDDQELHKRPM